MVAQPNTLHSVKRQGSKHALLFKVGKCLEENPLVLDIGIFVLCLLVSLSVGSNSAKLFLSIPTLTHTELKEVRLKSIDFPLDI